MLFAKSLDNVDKLGIAIDVLLRDGSGGAQRKQANHRTDLDLRCVPVRESQNVIEEAILFVPETAFNVRISANGTGNQEEMLHELFGRFRTGRRIRRQLHGYFEQGLSVQSHPGCTVSLLEVSSGRQRLAAVEDAYVVQSEKTALEYISTVDVLSVHPP